MADDNVTCEKTPIWRARLNTAKYIAAHGMRMAAEAYQVGEVYSLVYTDDITELESDKYYTDYTCRTFVVLGVDPAKGRIFEARCGDLPLSRSYRVMRTKDLLACDSVDSRVKAELMESMSDAVRMLDIIRNSLLQ